MGRQKDGRPFTKEDLHNRDLVLTMLKAEDELFMSDLGQEHLRRHGGIYTIESNKVMQREILKQHGFLTDDDSLSNYRSVIHVYYRSPTDYDKEVMNSVVYLRENHLLYYPTVKPQPGQDYIDVELLTLDGQSKVKLSELMKEDKGKNNLLVAAFSVS